MELFIAPHNLLFINTELAFVSVSFKARDFFQSIGIETEKAFISQLSQSAIALLTRHPTSNYFKSIASDSFFRANDLVNCRIQLWHAGSGVTGLLFESFAESENNKFEDLKRANELILSSAGEGIYGLDANGYTTFANEASSRILGWSAEEIIGKSLHEIHHHSYADGSHYPKEKCYIYSALKDGLVHRIDHEVFWRSDGTSIPVEYVSTPIIQGEEITGAVVIFRDISARLALEAQQQKDFEEISRLKEELEAERDYLRSEVIVSQNNNTLIGNSEAFKRTLAQVNAVAQTTSSVLVSGESGVGKELIARAIHNQSNRQTFPLVKVNCAAIPRELFESEFFGHVKGAFSGAIQDRVGKLQLAHKGTLFLDEIGELPLDLQTKLLRAIQEKEFERVGDNKTIKVDVRIVAATNRNLEQEVKQNHFREDLYYRLSVFPIKIPPLRNRKEDIFSLANVFIKQCCEEVNKPLLSLTRAQKSLLESYEWPGNIRELKNIIERSVIMAQQGKLAISKALSINEQKENLNNLVDETEIMTASEINALEKKNILACLKQAKGKVSGPGGAAELFGIKSTTFNYRMQKYKIDLSEN